MVHLQLLGAAKNKKRHLGHSHKFARQPRALSRLINKVHLLHETILSRLGRVEVSSDAQIPTQRVQESEEIKVKWRNMIYLIEFKIIVIKMLRIQENNS